MKIEIIVSPNGQTKVETKGFVGDSCRQASEFIEKSLGTEIRSYFLSGFYKDHLQTYKKRPIYWMFSSPKGSFNALIYMHRYRPDTVSVVLNQYVREFIHKLEVERARLEKLALDPTATPAQQTKAQKETAAVIKQIAELTTRVTVIENNSQRGRIDRKEADAELKALLQELVRQGASTNERLARLEVRFDAADRERR